MTSSADGATTGNGRADVLDYSFTKPISVSALQALLAQTSWASARSDAEIALVIANTPVQLGVWQADRLVGYARALTDGRFRALIDDVIVDEPLRKSGIGTEIMRRLTTHLSEVEKIYLLADDHNASYYARLGFTASTANCLSWPKPSPR